MTVIEAKGHAMQKPTGFYEKEADEALNQALNAQTDAGRIKWLKVAEEWWALITTMRRNRGDADGSAK